MDETLQNAVEAVRNARCAIAVTGAGISVGSGIPAFRGENSIWERYPADEYATIDAFLRTPGKVWRFWRELAVELADAQPNPAHDALARLEASGHIKAIITQNIDSLHHRAGSKNVVEYHGHARSLSCVDCGTRIPISVQECRESVPRCPACRGLAKPDIVMFGEMIPTQALAESNQFAEQCDCVLIVGTSAQVYPAAGIPLIAKRHGAYIIEANIAPTDFTPVITDAFIQGPAEETLPRLADAVVS